MGEQVLKDRQGRTLGKIKELSSGKLEARDRTGKLLGTFDPKGGETRDRTGKLVGKGDFLASLITNAAKDD